MRCAIVMVGMLGAAAGAMAQEAMYTAAATMPSPGVVLARAQFHYTKYGTGDEGRVKETELYEAMLGAQIGIAPAWSLTVDVPLQWRRESLAAGGSETDQGVADLDVMFKWRVYQNDSGGIDTFRVALMGGATVASGDDSDFSSQTVNPHVGAVATFIRGRHGGNVELAYRLNTGGDGDHNFGGDSEADVFFYNASYVYRVVPEAFTAQSKGAWYAVGELLGIYEVNGDNEIRASLGAMYEGRRFGFEAMMLLPVYDRLRNRAELDIGAGFGFRYLF